MLKNLNLPSIHIDVSQSDAPTVIKIFFPFHLDETLTSLLYHPIFALSGNPESFEPHGKGTIIVFSNFFSPLNQESVIPSLLGSNLKPQ